MKLLITGLVSGLLLAGAPVWADSDDSRYGRRAKHWEEQDKYWEKHWERQQKYWEKRHKAQLERQEKYWEMRRKHEEELAKHREKYYEHLSRQQYAPPPWVEHPHYRSYR